MKCYNCGKTVKKEDKFCPECGANLAEYKGDVVVEEAKTSAEKPTENQSANEAEQKIGKSGRLSIAGFVLGLCGLCCTSIVMSILGIVFGAVSKSAEVKPNPKSKGFAVAGIVLGIVGLVVTVIEIIVKKWWWFY